MNAKTRRFHDSKLIFLFFPVILLLLVGCSPIARAEQVTITGTVALEPGQVIGQSIVPNYDGMTGIDLYIDPKASTDSNSEIQLRLSPFSDRSKVIAQSVLTLSQVSQPGFYRFQFPPVQQSNRQDFYFSLELVGSGLVEIAKAPGTVYLDGAMYVDQQPIDAQMTFKIAYDPLWLAVGLGKEIAQWVGVLLAAAFISLPPGWAIFTLIDRNWVKRSLTVKLVLAASLSLVIYPLLLLWTDLIGIHLGSGYAWAPPLLGVGYLTWKHWPFRANPIKLTHINKVSAADLTLILLMIVVLFGRFWSIRLLDVGLWGDSYQHTVISQLIVDNGGLFNSWQPYTELTTFTYHFAFHTWVAIFHWITGIDIAHGVLWVGQLINALSIFVLYPLAIRLVGSQWAGPATVLIAGLLLPVPMVYANWGRYTQLAGQVILPAAIFLLWEWLEDDERKRSWPVLHWVLWSGMALAHYRIAILALLFLPAYFIAQLPGSFSWSFVKKTVGLGLGSGVLFLPWFIRVFGGKIMALFGVVVQNPVAAGISEDPTASFRALLSYASPILWILVVLVLGWGLWQRNRRMLIFFLWWVFIFTSANPEWINLPGKDLISSFAVAIAVYILIGPILGAAVGYFLTTVTGQISTWFKQVRFQKLTFYRADHVLNIALIAAFVLGGSLGALSQKKLLQIDQYSLLARPDLRAFDWIKTHTPTQTKFLVNAFLAFNNYVPAGSDGGWWLAFLAERGSTLPPITSGFEQGPTPDYLQHINQLVRLIKEHSIASDIVYQELKARQVSHVYVGHQHGKDPVNSQLFLPEELLASPNFHLVYRQDRVWIFEIR